MSQPKKTIALLPMKANSERVPGKNFRMFCGKPLFRWVLDALLKADGIDQVVINTDARQILSDHGLVESDQVRIRDRPERICGDNVSMNLVIEDDLNAVDGDTFLMTHTTNPLMVASTISQAVDVYHEAVESKKGDSLFSVNRVQTRFYRQDGTAVNHDPNNLVRTQDLEPWYEENSNIYIFSKESFAATQARIGSNPLVFETPRMDSLDIDTPEDWELAELVAQHRHMMPASKMLG